MFTPLKGSLTASSSLVRVSGKSSSSSALLRREQTEELINEYENRQWDFVTFALACVSGGLANMNYTLLIAFFPKEAEKRGLSRILIGIIISMAPLFNFITAFFVPNLIKKYGASRCLIFGNAFQALCVALMIIPGKIYDSTRFFLVVFILRMIHGCVAAVQEIASTAIVMRSIPTDKIPEAITYSDMARLLGTLSGPLLGGGLYQAAGYDLPFIAASSLFALNTVMLSLVRMSIDDYETSEESPATLIQKILRQPPVWLCMVSMITTSLSIGFLDPSLQPFLQNKQFHMSNAEVGLVATLPSLAFVVIGIITPNLLKYIGSVFGLFIGFFLLSSSYFIMAPPKTHNGFLEIFSFLHQDSFSGALALFLTGMSIQGASLVFFFNPITFIFQRESEFLNLTIEESSDCIATIVNQCITFGGFVGPILGGALVHALGFPKGCAVLGWLAISISLPITLSLWNIYKRRGQVESNLDLSDLLLEIESNRSINH